MIQRILVFIFLGACVLTGRAQEQVTETQAYLNRFEEVVVSVENDSVVNWERCDSLYDRFRADYKQKYKNQLSDDQLMTYNKLKTRYLKQLSIKKVGGDLKKKAKRIGASIRGTIEGVVD